MNIEFIGTVFFAFALVHTFLVSYFAKLAKKFEKGTAGEALLNLLSEVEVVFGFWAFVFLAVWALFDGIAPVIRYQQSLQLTEPLQHPKTSYSRFNRPRLPMVLAKVLVKTLRL